MPDDEYKWSRSFPFSTQPKLGHLPLQKISSKIPTFYAHHLPLSNFILSRNDQARSAELFFGGTLHVT
jgi:hypothetical protein